MRRWELRSCVGLSPQWTQTHPREVSLLDQHYAECKHDCSHTDSRIIGEKPSGHSEHDFIDSICFTDHSQSLIVQTRL